MSKLTTTTNGQYPGCEAKPAAGPQRAKRVDIVSLRLVREKSLLYGQRRIRCAEDGYELLRAFLEAADREYFMVACLSAKNEPLNITVASVGSLDMAIVHPREVFKTAVHCGASAILVAHNHPSGVPDPSQQDLDITRRLVNAGHVLGVDVLDHIIVGDGSFTSFRASGHFGDTE